MGRATREVSSQELFRGERTVVIAHAGEQYRLMITRNDKLILQK
ncbi:MAG: hemin uptake protein HemP [Planctomycetota bacterium]